MKVCNYVGVHQKDCNTIIEGRTLQLCYSFGISGAIINDLCTYHPHDEFIPKLRLIRIDIRLIAIIHALAQAA